MIIANLRRIRSNPDIGEQKYKTIITDLKKFEKIKNIKLIPEMARTDANIRIFTEEEKANDFVTNGKGNRRK